MTYREIIEDNVRCHTSVKWWPLYAYHYTDITNVVAILEQGCLYSRMDATRRGIMRNDNASTQVINMTSPEITSSVRFYYRPLTPTQYHNEGFKHPDICMDHANVPVPVFLAFDLERLLQMPGVTFSEMTQAGRGSRLCHTPEEFARFHFDQIYKSGWMTDAESEKRYRQAEILAEGPFMIDSCLSWVLCRNDVEKITLLNLLRTANPRIYTKYKDRISVCRTDMFECNGLYVSDCKYYNNTLVIRFSDPKGRSGYTNRHRGDHDILRPLDCTIDLEWRSSPREVITRQSARTSLDYERVHILRCSNLIAPRGARSLYTRITVEGKLLCYMGEQLSGAALL